MTTTHVVLTITGRSGWPWWKSLGLPPPWKWGDDESFAYVVAKKEVEQMTTKRASWNS